MQYETFAVPGAAIPADRPCTTVDEYADLISGVYERVAEQGGEIIATHTLDCDVEGPRQGECDKEPFSIRETCLFFVAEFPDDADISVFRS
jgi:hypothetical protein